MRMKDFAAIDFETANGERSSVCSVGIVIVKDGVVREKIYRLIRPFPNYYSYFRPCGKRWPRGWRAFRWWPTTALSTRDACGRPSKLSVWAILTMPSIARVVPLDVPSASSCPTTSFRRWLPDAATT